MVQKQRPQERKLKLSLQQNIFVMFFLFRTCGCEKNVNSEEEAVVAILQSLMEKSYRVWWKNLTGPDGKILHGRKEASKLWRNWRRAEKNLVSRKGCKTDWIKGRHKKLCQAFEREEVATFLFWKKWIGSGWRPPRSRQRRPTSREKAGSSSRKMMETALACLSSWPQVNF